MKQSWKKLILAVVWSSILILWFFGWQHTPDGWLGKLHAIGYSVCHQIPAHSFTIGDTNFPLCARCTGMYMGALIGLIFLFPLGKKAGLPPHLVIALMVFFIVAWLVDGANSFFSDLMYRVILYPPNNTLRLLTGFGMGFSIAITLATLLNNTIWQIQDRQLLIRNLYPLLGMFITGILILWGISIKNEILMTIFAYLSIGSVVLLLCLLHTIMWIILLKKENTFNQWQDVIPFLSLGLLSATVQIILLDILRFTLTGTW